MSFFRGIGKTDFCLGAPEQGNNGLSGKPRIMTVTGQPPAVLKRILITTESARLRRISKDGRVNGGQEKPGPSAEFLQSNGGGENLAPAKGIGRVFRRKIESEKECAIQWRERVQAGGL